MKRKTLYEIIKTPESAYQYAKTVGIVYLMPQNCDFCGNIMSFEEAKTRSGLNGMFRCQRPCRKSKALTYNSIFYDSRLHINKCLEIMYFYAEKKPSEKLHLKLKFQNQVFKIGLIN